MKNLAKDNDFFGLTIPQRDARIVAESHATDSFQNVLFSLLRFRLHTGFYPERISVVTHDFKRRRFMECHFPSLGLVPAAPRQQHRSEHACRGLHASGADSTNASKTGKMVQVIGIDPPEIVTARETLLAGEEQNGFGLWVHDWYGCGPALARKRLGRGWKTGLEESLFVNVGLEPLVEDLVCWRGGRNGNEQFPGLAQLPWACADITLTGSFAAATTKGHNG